jgi:multimeric flavodoxin WrbA
VKSIVGIVGSARRLGNCEIFVKEVSRNINLPHELVLLRLSSFRLEPCRGCYVCLFAEERCPRKDDLYSVLEPIAQADAIIVAAPAYFLGASANLRRLTDRGLSFYAYIDKLWGKPAVAAAVAGIPGKEGATLLGVENFARMLLADLKVSRVVYGALPGEVFLDGKNRRVAAEMAAALFTPKRRAEPHRCPLCGGDTFRFLGGNRVRCMLCSNAGTVSMEEQGPHVHVEKGAHELFLSREEAEAHRQWLIGMKDRFIADKKKLKQISSDYRRDGRWVEPPADRGPEK